MLTRQQLFGHRVALSDDEMQVAQQNTITAYVQNYSNIGDA